MDKKWKAQEWDYDYSIFFAGLAVSSKHTYMFSAGDDKQVKCWDLEQNKVGMGFGRMF